MPIPLDVVILEDQVADAELLVHALEAAGFAPLKVRHCDSEPSFLAALDPAPDLVLADYQLQQFTGLDALRLLRGRALEIPFILVSGAIDEEMAVLALREGATDYVLKERMTRLGAAVERALEQKRMRDEQTRGQNELRRLAAIVESSNDAIISRALDGTILSWNAAAERMFGWSATETIGRSISILAPPERRGQIRRLIERMIDGESIERFETTHLRKDGSRIVTAMTLSLVKDGQGRVVYIAETMRDITRRKQLEREAQQKAAITVLMESLARAANEAATPEAAMQTCLARICEHGRWVVGHLMHLAPRGDEWIVTQSQWHPPDQQRFSEFVTLSDNLRLRPRPDGFITTAIIGHRPCWIADLSAVAELGRLAHARDLGIRAALAFPVIVRDEVVTCFEFFAEEVREPDTALLEALPSVASQLARVIERRRAELELQRKAELTQLLEALAVAANEAATPDAAIQSCLEHIWRHGKWQIAHALTLDPNDPMHELATSHWRVPDPGRFRAFMASSEVLRYGVHPRGFMTLIVHGKRPIWVADIAGHEGFTRRDIALACGLKSAFAFPVMVQDRVAACLEFFADEVREPDTLFLEAIATVGSQLARAMERKQALDELHASQQKLESILAALEEVVWSMDVHSGKILYLNPAVHKLTGRPVRDFLGSARVWRRVIHPADRLGVRKGVCELLDHGKLVQEFRIVRPDGAVRTVENRVHVVHDERGRPQRIDGTMSDITERKQVQEQLTYLAQYDSLTGLPNRNLFRDRLALAMARAKRNRKMLALMFLDLDRFKEINDTLGHAAGDEVLRAVARLLRDLLRDVDTVARLAGDEFTIMLENITDTDQAATVARKIKDALSGPIAIQGRTIYVTASIGITLFPRDVGEIDALLQSADVAMYHAKAEGRNTYEFYVPDMSENRNLKTGNENP
ncbi:MAG: hypothetical protein A3G24_18265 [Betaproteobacteria bacterium RIFCSPLOWO2_12_FULL_62_13]|nr:MAG: hypothetical protein A3G24_18265 [Betaproteobacteria bacterium RIFCSPLOWO2_12_FULL_62_13]